jgi:hypothetical protein
MRPSDLSWSFARKSKQQDEFEEFEGGFGEEYEEEMRAASDDDDDEEESREIDFEDPNFARGEGIWKNYSEDLDLEE